MKAFYHGNTEGTEKRKQYRSQLNAACTWMRIAGDVWLCSMSTGVVPRHLPGSPRHDPRVRVLRTIDDALAVRHCLHASNKPAVVIGGGLIGTE